MDILKDYYSSINNSTKITLEINLVKNRRFDYCRAREDYLNWIPFEFAFQVGENESYVYPNEFGATFSLTELKSLFKGTRDLFEKIKARDLNNEEAFKESLAFDFYTLETYFGIRFVDGYYGLMSVTVWITMGLIPNSTESGYKKGFRFTAALDDVEKFIAELNAQLNHLL